MKISTWHRTGLSLYNFTTTRLFNVAGYGTTPAGHCITAVFVSFSPPGPYKAWSVAPRGGELSNGTAKIAQANFDLNPISRRPAVALTTLGCKLNQAETDSIARDFTAGGFAIVDFSSRAEVYVINTCTVTHVADRKSRQLIRQARRLNPDALIIVTGCYADVSPDEIVGIDSIDVVIPNDRKSDIVSVARGYLGIEDHPLHPAEASSPSRTRAFVKIQDGCNQFCTYCIVPYARGRERSVPMEAVHDSVNRCHAMGFKEVVLTGVHIGTYGRDLPGDEKKVDLADLVRSILRHSSIPRIRLSSIEPQDLTERMLDLWPTPRLCRHLHLPLQSGSDEVLRRMRRPYTVEQFRKIVDAARSRVPELAVTTDIIVGFPGETDEDFRHTYHLGQETAFAGTHVFKYSPRKGTPAARLLKQVPYEVKKERSEALMKLGQKNARVFASHFLGLTLDVLYESRVESADPDRPEWEGLTDNYIRVVSPGSVDLANQIHSTRLVGQLETALRGEVLD